MYSAASSNSSNVAEGPRFNNTGRPLRPHGFQEAEVLHVPRADLQHVGIAGDQGHVAGGNHLGHKRQAGLLPGRGQNLQAVFLQSLKTVGTGAGFERAAAQGRGPPGLHGMGHIEQLSLVLHGTGPGNHAQMIASNGQAAGADDGRLRLGGAAGEPIGARLAVRGRVARFSGSC